MYNGAEGGKRGGITCMNQISQPTHQVLIVNFTTGLIVCSNQNMFEGGRLKWCLLFKSLCFINTSSARQVLRVWFWGKSSMKTSARQRLSDESLYRICLRSPHSRPHKIILPLVFTFRAKFFASTQLDTQPKQHTVALALCLHSKHPRYLICMCA